MKGDISYQEIYEAYKKFKNYCYYDNSSMYARKVIADFEADFFDKDRTKNKGFKELFMEKMSILMNILNGKDNNDKELKKLINKVSCILIPKSPKEDDAEDEKEIRFISNVKKTNDKISVDSVNALVKAPLEIHLVSVLWLMIVGVRYAGAIGDSSYANQFELKDVDSEEQRMSKGYHLYKPYYVGYQDWRDKAMKEAERLLDDGRNATIVSLDIKRFYYSVRINLAELLGKIELKSKKDDETRNIALEERLTSILQLVHEKYHKKVAKYIEDSSDKKDKTKDDDVTRTVLPVGLLSSGFIANLYLSEFDYQVSQRLKSSYYGRYVDDMMFVFPDMILEDNPNDFIKRTLVESNILRNKKDDNGSYTLNDYKELHYDNLVIQNKKIVVEHFDHHETRAALKKFITNLNKQRSEFRFIPDEENVESDFDNSAFNLQYTDSVNKFRSIKDFSEDKYGASSYLAHKIFLSCYTTSTKDKKEIESRRQIIQFFSGQTAIFFYTLWEKVSTYFIINGDAQSLRLFLENIIDAIELVSCDKSDTEFKLTQSLREQLINSVAMALAVFPKFKLNSKNDDVNQLFKKSQNLAKSFRHSNLFPHSRLTLPALPMTNTLLSDDINLMNPTIGDCDLGTDNEMIKWLFPRFIHYDEVSIIKMYDVLSQKEYLKDDKHSYFYNDKLDNVELNINKCYNEFNYDWYSLFNTEQAAETDDKVKFVNIHHDPNSSRTYVTLKDDFNGHWSLKKLRIAIANMKVDSNVVLQTATGRPNLTLERRAELFSIINTAIKNDAQMLVLPELSVPYQWLGLLAQQCKKNHIAIVAGLTYFCNKHNYAFNLVATLLPISIRGFKSCFVNLRLKNHYSPQEISTLEGYRYNVPSVNKAVYNLFHWHNLYFTVYNCFELASIEDRSLFKSQVDLMIATELNRDTNYFAEIAGAWVRDLHAFFVQVNTSEFGDSRIMKPSSKDTRNMVVVTGGENSTVLVKDLDIKGLRHFEFKEYNLEEKDRTYKMTPPDFVKSKALARMNDEEMYDAPKQSKSEQ